MQISAAKPDDCCLCARVSRDLDSPGNKDAPEETVLYRRDGIAVSGARGALVEGWLLLFPDQHAPNFAKVPASTLGALADVLETVRGVYWRAYRMPLMAFEHGPVTFGASARLTCVPHAHLHCVPFEGPLIEKLKRNFASSKVRSLRELPIVVSDDAPYIYFESDTDGAHVFRGELIPSQLMRRLIAIEIGKPDEWDWRRFPQPDVVRATANRLAAFFPDETVELRP